MDLKQLYKQINDATIRDYPVSSLHDMITVQCCTNPDGIAVLDAQASQTYAELNRKSNELANYLQLLGIGAGDLVGLCCDRNVDTPAMLVGIMKSGAGYVPLDPDYPVDRLVYMVENSEVKHVIGNENQLPLLEKFDTPFTVAERDWDKVAAAGSEDPKTKVDPVNDTAYVIYTSGSTGKPKGVVVQHSAATNFLCSMAQVPGFTPDDRLLATTTLSFDISVFEMFLPLITGGSVAVVSRETAKDTVALVAAMEKFEVNLMQATPAMWRMILETDFAGRSEMRFVSAGEPLPRDLVKPLVERCGELWNLYGPTETTVYSTAKLIFDGEPVLVGTPIANTQIYIVDDAGELCPPGTPGELLIAGDGVTMGYLKRPEKTAAVFCDYKGIHVYRTGDLARLTPDHEIDHMGRMDNQIKFNGHRIELG